MNIKRMRGQLHRQAWRTFMATLFLLISILIPPAVRGEGQDNAIKGTIKIYDTKGQLKKNHNGVVVFLDEIENPPAQMAPPTKNPVITQINKTFIPEVLPIMVGTTINFPNEDTVYHNVFSVSKAKPFDLGLYPQGSQKTVTFDKPGLVKIYCNIHPQMIASILVLTNPYFTMTDNDGHFEIHNVPEGKAVIRTWYPRTKKYPEKEVVVPGKGIEQVNLLILENMNFQIKEDIILIDHKNKWGQDYPSKY